MNLRALKHQGISRTAGKNSSFVYVHYTTLVNLLFYIDTVLEKYHFLITTYDTVKLEYDSYNLSAKDESKKPKVSLKRKDADSNFDDSESDSFGKTKKSKGRRSVLSLTSNGGDLSWVCFFKTLAILCP